MTILPLYSMPPFLQRALVNFHIAMAGLCSLIHWGNYPGLRILVPNAFIFAWLIYAPDLFRLSSLFIIGLIMDSLMNLPLGISFGSYWLLWWMTLGQRSFLAGQRFLIGWLSFLITTGIVELFRSSILAFSSDAVGSWHILGYDMLVVFILYPLIAMHVRWIALRLKQLE